MKRDDLVLRSDAERARAEERAVARRALYLGQGDEALFGWLHQAEGVATRDCVAVICPPIGHEYTRSHRTMRHLADRLARAGTAALRFDYRGTGDSPGMDLEPDRFEAWQESIRLAIAEAQRLSGRERVCLVGLRLGATLAARVAAEAGVDWLVLWNPAVKGRTYARELQAIALSAERSASVVEGGLETAGFTMTQETLEALRAIDLLEEEVVARKRVLFVGRDDISADRSLCDRLRGRGIATDFVEAPGWTGMMADHQFTVVPDEALTKIVDWVSAQTEKGAETLSLADRGAAPRRSWQMGPIEERLCQFGKDAHLFGILSRPIEPRDRPVVVMLSAGAIHHVGPHRLYVTLSRRLAAEGFPCLRFDLGNLGDSIRRAPGRENHPYPESAIADVRAALAHLWQTFGYRRFILLGLCSGSHTAFHASLDFPHEPVEEVVLVNPWNFYWVEGMTLDTAVHFADAAAYSRSMRDPGRWMKLLRGEVDLARLARFAFAHSAKICKSYWDVAREIVAPESGPRLARDLRRVLASRRVSVFVADSDPGRRILLTEAKRTVRKAIASGRMHLQVIAPGDHTFSQSRPRHDLMSKIVAHLKKGYAREG